jgi:hypothetical protein
MFPVLLRIAILMGVLSAIYIALDWYLRWDKARRLNARHSSGEGSALSREDFVAKGLAEYDRSWGRKLLPGVFILPIVIALTLALIVGTI